MEPRGNGTAATVTGARDKQAKEGRRLQFRFAAGGERRKRGAHRENPRGIYARAVLSSLPFANEPDQTRAEQSRPGETINRERERERESKSRHTTGGLEPSAEERAAV